MLSKLEREVITDSMLKIQSIEAGLHQIDGSKVVNIEEIHSCLRSAGSSFQAALRSTPSTKSKRSDLS
jgi:hypothetical protein